MVSCCAPFLTWSVVIKSTRCAAFSQVQLVVSHVQRNGSTRSGLVGRQGGMLCMRTARRRMMGTQQHIMPRCSRGRPRGRPVRQGGHAGALGQAACCLRCSCERPGVPTRDSEVGAQEHRCARRCEGRSARRASGMRCWRRDLREKVRVRLVYANAQIHGRESSDGQTPANARQARVQTAARLAHRGYRKVWAPRQCTRQRSATAGERGALI